MILRLFVIALFLLMTPGVQSQYYLEGEVTGQGQISTGERLPFWMYHNTRGRISANTNGVGWLTGRVGYQINEDSFFEVGAGGLVRDETADAIFFDELYLHLQNRNFYVTGGRKHQKDFYNGLSSTNRHIVWSLNPRPLPGVQVGTNGPIFFSREEEHGFGFEGFWSEYFLEEERYVSEAKLHHKNLLLVYRTRNNFEVKAGLQHFVQWGGTSPRHGQLPGTVNDYLRLIIGMPGGENVREVDQLNALGNQLGGYELYVTKAYNDFKVQLLYNHIFEDGSGLRLGNTPDGRYGVFLEFTDKDKLLNSVMYEFYYTHHQSHTTSGIHKYDRYLTHSTYRSDFTYFGRVMGSPFFTEDPDGQGIINNKFTAHHLGIGGQYSTFFNTYPYKILLSYAKNDGTYGEPYSQTQDVGYIHSELGLFRGILDLDVHLGVEYNTFSSPLYGIGLQVRRRF